MIVESSDEAQVREFMQPFAMAGSLDVYPAATCAGVVASGGCAAAMPGVDAAVPALDPDEACEQAIAAGLVVHRAHPLNCETSIPELMGGVVVPNLRFYVRNHFQIPKLDQSSWRLKVSGLVEHSLSLTLRDLEKMPAQSCFVTLECAGNGRSTLNPRVTGEQWNLGAVSTAEWTGVPLLAAKTSQSNTKSDNTAKFETKTESSKETDIVKRLDASAAVLNEIMGTPDKAIPSNVLADAKRSWPGPLVTASRKQHREKQVPTNICC